jgi:hypothetical protein
VIALVLAGCAPAPGADPPATEPPETHDTGPAPDLCAEAQPEVTGGFGSLGDPFVAAQAGTAVVMIHPPDAYHHLDTAVRVVGIHPLLAITPSVAVVADGRIISGLTYPDDDWNQNTVYTQLLEDGPCSGTSTGVRAFLHPVPGEWTWLENICPLAGTEVEVRWDVEDLLDGRTSFSSVRAILALDPVDIAPCAAYGTTGE